MNQKVLFITPPFTQLNTPYPATAYLKGFCNTIHVDSFQVDMGIEVILKLFSKSGLEQLFDEAAEYMNEFSENTDRIFQLQDYYIQTISPVIAFLQGKNPTLAPLIVSEDFLPQASRFADIEDLEWEFGKMGSQDKAKHLATLYLEDLGDFISETFDPHFGFSRYAEHLGRSASTFDLLEEELNLENTFIDDLLIQQLEQKINNYKPTVVALSIPFPGNLYSGLKCAQWIKATHPDIKVVLGGGYANTELRSLSDSRIFNYVDYITLDDGEAPFQHLLEHFEGKREQSLLKRTFLLVDGEVTYVDGSKERDYAVQQVGTPDYTDLPLDKYISVIEVANPMHSLWSNGRWNKLTLAHGCYWGRCTFCDTSLDYIKRFEPQTAKHLCDKMEELIAKTGESGFHFVDEAAPPALLKELALEIIRRRLVVSWWGNIRFEKNFSNDLCQLLKASGCIAVSGGLEVASDRLLSIINKGVKVEQVAKVAQHFTDSGIMVHAYLMYGFPTQSDQETIDSLEVVRQIFMHGIVNSAFWHLFTMTAHSPIGMNPSQFSISKKSEAIGSFANNDVPHIDKIGAKHEKYSEGLKKSLYNYMHDVGFDMPLHNWFEFKTPRTTIAPNYIEDILNSPVHESLSQRSKVVWMGSQPEVNFFTKSKKGKKYEMAELKFIGKTDDLILKCPKEIGEWLEEILPSISVYKKDVKDLSFLEESYEGKGFGDFELFVTGREFNKLRQNGMLIL